MLCLGRKKGQIVDIFVDERIISVKISGISGHASPLVKLGFSADEDVKIYRREISPIGGRQCET